VYLSILFNLFLLYGDVPDDFHQATTIPLVKCKSGDLSDVNNYTEGLRPPEADDIFALKGQFKQ